MLQSVIGEGCQAIWVPDTTQAATIIQVPVNAPPTSHTQAFLAEIAALSEHYGLSLAHEDTHGSFQVQPYRPENIEWLLAASNQELETKEVYPGHWAMRSPSGGSESAYVWGNVYDTDTSAGADE